MKVLVIGAGAAGCFCAIRLKRAAPEVSVTVLEAGRTALAKVAVTGGGRCNLTNSFEGIRSLQEAYPRGHRLIERAFRLFGPKETMRWFEDEGVRLVLQEDHCVFPASQDAMEIVQTLLRGMREAGVELRTGCRVKQVLNEGNGYKVLTDNEVFPADAVVVTTGGSPRRSGIAFLDGLDIETVDPVPSLFSFNIEVPALRALMGLVVPAAVSLPGTKFRAAGPLLITDWGLSGPAVLKLSSYAARYLAEMEYRTPLSVHWYPDRNEMEIREMLLSACRENPRKMLHGIPPDGLPARLWAYLLERAVIRSDIRCNELGSKGLNRLVATLSADGYDLAGKNRFRDEFVTCGGVSLDSIHPVTLEAKKHPGLHFAGEVLDIDAITGGFNLQAAWSTGAAVAKALAEQSDQQVVHA